ncbi:hypothetical protein WJX73_000972 [Symbiochloris irregularis]|uniref:S5 DRBM domain-containing protein n=1 Tax=Symbiochloris irregularis TaxID=706552 RepID=A0AAW1NVL5_9CHLO
MVQQRPLSAQATEENAVPSTSQPAFVTTFQSANEKKRALMLSQLATGELAPYGREGEARHQERVEEWMSDFMSQVINIRGVSKGMRTGGIRRFSAVVVAGNRQGVLGMGTGKASELAAAVSKANMRALKNLFTVPRYNDATTWQARTAKYGKAKVITYPRSSGSGIMAAPMLSAICDLAGIRDIGVKVHGTRNAINIVKAFIIALESQNKFQK